METILELEEARTSSREDNRNSARAAANGSAPVKPPPRASAGGLAVGRLVGIADTGEALVDFAANRTGAAVPARSVVALAAEMAGCEVVLAFADGELAKPVVMGCLQPLAAASRPVPVEVKLDGRQVQLSAEEELVLRCGKASITLTRAGKVIIRGAYLLSRSSGVNRIKGGSVQIN